MRVQINIPGNFSQLLVGLFFLVERLPQRCQDLVILEPVSERMNRSISADFTVFHPLGCGDECRILQIALKIVISKDFTSLLK